MLIYLVIDLSLLRGASREENLAKLVAAVTRTVLSHAGEDAMQFGFRLTDSHVGGYMLSYQLNMVAQGMGIPKNVATTSACDLTGDDLINMLTLVKLVTDANVVAELNLRASRNSRSSDIPAVEMCRVLHTVLKTTCVHTLQASVEGGSSSLSGGSREGSRTRRGCMLLMTPSLGSNDVLHGYVGKEALEACGGDVGRAFLRHLPLSLWKAVGSHRLSCVWMSGNAVEDEMVGLMGGIEKEVRAVFPGFSLTTLDVGSAGGVTMEAFGACTGLRGAVERAGQEASSKCDGGGLGCVDAAGIWEETAPHSTIELLQDAMAKMMPRAASMTPLGRKTRRNSNSGRFATKSGSAKQLALSKAVGGASKRTRRGAAAGGVTGGALQSRRGQKAIRRARMAEQPRGAGALEKNGNETPTSTVDQNANANVPGSVADAKAKGLVPYVDNLLPCTMEEAGIRIRAAVARIEAQVLERTASAGKGASISAGLDAVPLLTATIQKAITEVAKHALDQGEPFDAAACRKAFVDMACTPVKELQQRHRTTPFAQLQVLAWTCAVQLLLRLCIGTTSCSWAGEHSVDDGALSSTISLSPEGFAAVEDIMHIIVATMSPIPSQGHTLFLNVIKPSFMGRMKDDIKRLEKSIWDEEEMAVDGDGALADVRIAAESLEESGETPDMSMDGSDDGNDRKKAVVSKKVETMVMNGNHASASAATAATAQPAMSADGSGIHGGGNYGGTAASGRRGELSSSNLLSRRFNNSKQYKMVVRANPGKSKMAPATKAAKAAKTSAANPNKSAKESSKATSNAHKTSRPSRSAQTSGRDVSHAVPSNSKSHLRQVPDTPLGKAPGQTTPAERAHQEDHGGIITTPDTAMMKRAEDVIPNTSPREQPAPKAQMKRIGSIRQPLFDDTATETIFKASVNDDGPTKNTWLSGAIVKRRKPAPSGATRMGDMQNVDSTTLARQETEHELHREIMSPLKPRPRGTATGEPNSSLRTATVEEDVDDIEIVLSPGPFVPDRDDYTDDAARDGSNHEGTHGGEDVQDQGASAANDGRSGGQVDERDSDQHDGSNCNNGNNEDIQGNACNVNESGDAGDVRVEVGGRCETFETSNTFAAAMSDDEDSMAAKNDGQESDCSSSHLHGRDDGEDTTSPGGGVGKSADARPPAMKSPFACSTPEKPRLKAGGNAGDVTEVAPESTPMKPGSAGTKPTRRTARGGRLARMHGKTLHRVDASTTPTSQAHNQRSKTPTRSPIAIEDRGSPCKPSPGHISFSSPPRQPESPGAVDYASDTDSCMGDTPDVMVAMKPLMQAMPDKYDSDEEDAAILNAAANGGLSPVDSDKPAPVPRRIRKKALAAVTTRGPGEIARRNKAKAAAVTTETAATTRVPPKASHAQKRLTAPLGNMKRIACKSIDVIVADVDGAQGLDDRENQAGGGHAKVPANQSASRNPKMAKMTRMPDQGDVVVCFVKTMDAFVRSTIVKEGDVALARRGKGWCLTADVVPIGTDAENINAGLFTVKLDSTKEISPEETVSDAAAWYRVDPSSPSGPAIVHKAVRAAKEHTKSTKTVKDKICQKRTPILREIDNIVSGAVSGGPKRKKLQPTNLRYEGEALASAEKILSCRTPEVLPVTRVDGFTDFEATQGELMYGAPHRTSLLNAEAKSVIARAKALLADPRFS